MSKLKIDNKVIVACSQNFNGYGMLRSLAKAGLRPDMIVNRTTCPIIEKSRLKGSLVHYDDVYQIPDLLLEQYKDRQPKPIVICCDDGIQSAVNDRYDELSPYFLLSSISDRQGEITRHMDKKLQMEIAAKCGVSVPRTWLIEQNAPIPADMVYPCIAKVQESIFNRGMSICDNAKQLEEALSKSPCIVQQYIKKEYEIIVYGTSIDAGEYYMAGVTKKLRQYPKPDGMSSYCVLEDFDKHPGLDKKALISFLKALNYTGMFSIEMVVKDNVYYLCEINLRNDGKQYFSTVAGANLPAMYIQSLVGQQVQIPSPKYPTYAMGEFTDYHFVKDGDISVGRWLKDLLKSDSFFILNAKDPLPGIEDASKIIRAIFNYRMLRK